VKRFLTARGEMGTALRAEVSCSLAKDDAKGSYVRVGRASRTVDVAASTMRAVTFYKWRDSKCRGRLLGRVVRASSMILGSRAAQRDQQAAWRVAS
jgi:hypothetical protein